MLILRIMAGVVYRHPNSNFLAFQDVLFSTLHKLSSCNCPYYILRDFNIDFLKINSNTSVADFNNFTNCYSFHCQINKPTRITDHSSTLLDHLYQGFITGGKFPTCGKFHPCSGKFFLIWCSEILFYSNT